MGCISEFVVATSAHEQEAQSFARLLESDVSGDGDSHEVAFAGGQISLMSQTTYGERYGDLASSMGDRSSIFGALVLQTDTLDKIRNIVANTAKAVPMIDELERVVIRLPMFDSLLEFKSYPAED